MRHKVKASQSHPTLCDPIYCTVNGILQARILELVAMPCSRGFSQLKDQTQVSHTTGGFFTSQDTREAWDIEDSAYGWRTGQRMVGSRWPLWRCINMVLILSLETSTPQRHLYRIQGYWLILWKVGEMFAKGREKSQIEKNRNTRSLSSFLQFEEWALEILGWPIFRFFHNILWDLKE